MSIDAHKLSAAKLWLISTPTGQPTTSSPRGLAYLAHALYALVTIESSEIPRMTCDEHWRVYVNPTWFANAEVPQIAMELAHLTWHLLSDHTGRARSMGVDRHTVTPWNVASDVTVAHTLDADQLRPQHLPTAAERRLPPGKSSEEYFAMLSGLAVSNDDHQSGDGYDPSSGCGSGADGISRAQELGTGRDVGRVTELEARTIREHVAIEYREHVRRRGTDPGDALRWVREVLEPETPWERVLRAAVKRAVGWAAGGGDYTYSRPSRRASSAPNIVLPGQHRPLPRIAIVVDTSASVDDELLARALGEVNGVIEALGVAGAQVTAYSVDAAVHVTEQIRSARDVELVGAGGTDLRIGLAAIADERPRPDVAIVLTDGDTPWPESPPPGAAVIVALLGRRGLDVLPPTPDWAVRVECLVEAW